MLLGKFSLLSTNNEGNCQIVKAITIEAGHGFQNPSEEQTL